MYIYIDIYIYIYVYIYIYIYVYIYIYIYVYIYVCIYVYILHTQRDVQISELRNVDFEAPKNQSRHWEGPHLVQAQIDSQSSWSSAGSCHRWMIWSWVYLWKLLFWTSYRVKVSFFQPTSMIHVQIPSLKSPYLPMSPFHHQRHQSLLE